MAGLQERKLSKEVMAQRGWRFGGVDSGFREVWRHDQKRGPMYCLTPTAERTSANTVPPNQVSAVHPTA